jgi:hypothetical protein
MKCIAAAARGQAKLTICNLFANQKLSVAEIRHLLDEASYSSVIEALIQHKLVRDRRKKPLGLSREEERRISHFSL